MEALAYRHRRPRFGVGRALPPLRGARPRSGAAGVSRAHDVRGHRRGAEESPRGPGEPGDTHARREGSSRSRRSWRYGPSEELLTALLVAVFVDRSGRARQEMPLRDVLVLQGQMYPRPSAMPWRSTTERSRPRSPATERDNQPGQRHAACSTPLVAAVDPSERDASDVRGSMVLPSDRSTLESDTVGVRRPSDGHVRRPKRCRTAEPGVTDPWRSWEPTGCAVQTSGSLRSPRRSSPVVLAASPPHPNHAAAPAGQGATARRGVRQPGTRCAHPAHRPPSHPEPRHRTLSRTAAPAGQGATAGRGVRQPRRGATTPADQPGHTPATLPHLRPCRARRSWRRTPSTTATPAGQGATARRGVRSPGRGAASRAPARAWSRARP